MKTELDRNDFFKGIDQIEHKDYDVKLPIFYYDNACMSAIYTASTGELKKHLPHRTCIQWKCSPEGA